MSRTNPFKKKRRQANKTILIFGEGLDEKIFIKHLKGSYSHNKNISIKIWGGKGGGPEDIVLDAYRTLGAFDKRVVILDNEKSMPEMTKARIKAKQLGIDIIENTPCLESLFLKILGKKVNNSKPSQLKKEFEWAYLSEKRRRNVSEYKKIFPKKLLDSKRSQIPELDKLISVMEGLNI